MLGFIGQCNWELRFVWRILPVDKSAEPGVDALRLFVNDGNVALVKQWSHQIRMVCCATGTTPVDHEMVNNGSHRNFFETVLQVDLENMAVGKLRLDEFNQVERVA